MEEKEGLSLGDIFRIIGRYWIGLLATICVVTGAGFIVGSKLSKPTYSVKHDVTISYKDQNSSLAIKYYICRYIMEFILKCRNKISLLYIRR